MHEEDAAKAFLIRGGNNTVTAVVKLPWNTSVPTQ